MQFKSQKFRNHSTEEVNLIPMLDVMMSVLTFFIIVSLTFTGEKVSNVELPTSMGAGEGGTIVSTSSIQFIIGLNRQGELSINQKIVTEVEMLEQMQRFLANFPEGEVILKADRGLAYKKIAQVLQKMGEVGGDRISLALERG